MTKSSLAAAVLMLLSLSAGFVASAQPPQHHAGPAPGNQLQDAGPLHVYPKNRLSGPVDDRIMVKLPGNVHPHARPEFDAGPAAGGQPMPGIILALRRGPDQQAALDTLSADLQNPRSPLFHQWLTPESFGAHFGVSQSDLQQVENWLKSKGFTIDQIPAGHWMIVFSGTVAQVEAAFLTPIRYYRSGDRTYYANAGDPQVPEALSGMVLGFAGLNNFRPRPHRDVAQPRWLGGNGYFLAPSDFATIYDLNPLYQNGIKGNGINIAVIEPCTMDLSLALTYWNAEGISQQGWWYANYGNPPACAQDDIDEVYLDYEWAGAVAPQAQIWIVSSSNSDNLLGAVTGVVNSGVGKNSVTGSSFAPVLTMSYLSCSSQSYAETWIGLWQQAHTNGITSLVSSGDTGAAGCDSDPPPGKTEAVNGLAINLFCESPYVVCVGGTQFNDTANPGAYWSPSGNALGYIPEVAWNQTGANGGTGLWGASGGGYSTFTPKPAWQTGNASPYRGTPDIALTSSSPHDGYLLCDDTAADCGGAGGFQAIGGTSAAAPSLAGIMALLVQQTGQAQGNVNQTLYALAARNDVGLIFHDIISGNTNVPGQQGYSAGFGWDAATGLGSIDANALIANWSNAFAPEAALSQTNVVFGAQAVGTASAPQTVTLANQAVAPNLSGNLASLSVSNVTVTGNNAGDFQVNTTCKSVTLAAGSNCTLTVQLQPTASGTRTASISVFDNAPNSPQTIALTGTGGATGTSHVTVSCTPNPVYQQPANSGGYQWFYTITLTETAGIATTVTGFSIAGVDYSSSIAAFFGSASLAANGTLSSSLETKGLAVPVSNVYAFAGQDAGGAAWSAQTTVNFLGPGAGGLTLTGGALPAALQGGSYYTTLSVSGGVAPYKWSLVGGTLPNGVSLSAAAGTISGIPSAAGSFSPNIQVTDATGASASATFQLFVSAAPSGALSKLGICAQIATGGTWSTALTVVNTAAVPILVQVNLWGDNGQPQAWPLTFPQNGGGPGVTASSVVRSLAVGGSLIIVANAGASAPVEEGYAEILATGQAGAYAIFSQQVSSQYSAEGTAALDSHNQSTFIVPYDNTTGYVTSMAIANLSSIPADVTATIMDENGVVLAAAQPINQLVANGHTGFGTAAEFPVTNGHRGNIVFQSAAGQSITGMALRFSQLLTFTSVPVLYP